ncbi:hypothetical protein JVU11DRAFT_573 [Chiua virens]|nr:hypothetical protein JVU11DRAFT_573 [Chiua virens]
MRFPLSLRPRLVCRSYANLASSTRPATVSVLGQEYPTDEATNVSPTILSKVPLRLHTRAAHPLNTLRTLIESHFPSYAHLSSLSPLVTPYQNFDLLSFPVDHPGRSVTDSYYVNKNLMLRTHTSAHEVEVFERGETKWLLTADVYRRDEIDGSHYPVFHQTEGARIVSADANGMKEIQDDNVRVAGPPSALILTLFGDRVGATPQNPLRSRSSSGVNGSRFSDVKNKLGWAFGLGLERIAMVLYSIPDIRLFWSQDPRFLTQFKPDEITTFRPYSKYPACFKDVSFWLPENMDLHDNDFCDLVRDVTGDVVEDVKLVRVS